MKLIDRNIIHINNIEIEFKKKRKLENGKI